ncbi:MAG: hypothetical protein JXC32_20660 [Anaerolineae bacterium]|nr:hypothetical protein [Anaerolineae bacterium]
MTAMPMRRKVRSPLLWLVLAALLLVALPTLNGHATARHGRTAASAWRYVSRCDPGDPRLWCGEQEDGREVRILELDKLPGKPRTWAIVITCAGGLVTAFLSQHRQSVEKIRERCS